MHKRHLFSFIFICILWNIDAFIHFSLHSHCVVSAGKNVCRVRCHMHTNGVNFNKWFVSQNHCKNIPYEICKVQNFGSRRCWCFPMVRWLDSREDSVTLERCSLIHRCLPSLLFYLLYFTFKQNGTWLFNENMLCLYYLACFFVPCHFLIWLWYKSKICVALQYSADRQLWLLCKQS